MGQQVKIFRSPSPELFRHDSYANEGGAYKAFVRAMNTLRAETSKAAKTLRKLQNERYHTLLKAVWPAALDGDLGALAAALKIMDQQNNLNGLYRQQIEVNGRVSVDDKAQARKEFLDRLTSLVNSAPVVDAEIISESPPALSPGHD